VVLNGILGILAVLSFALTVWQWLVARRFPLHQRGTADFSPSLTVLKPLKGCDAATEDCLRSWFTQRYSGQVQILFAVASAEDPVCAIVTRLLGEYREADAQLIVCGELTGANAKVAKLVDLERLARHEILVVSDADVRVPPDFLSQVVLPLRDPAVGLVNCFYRLANPATMAMRWEAVAINADFWSQVLQSQSLKPIDFALGAVMVTRRPQLQEIGGFAALRDCLADDYQLGHRIAKRGHRIAISPVVVECWSDPMGWAEVWKHQLRWARTIRVCQPAPYFFSILSNAAIWPLLWLALRPSRISLGVGLACGLARIISAWDLQQRLTQLRPRFSDAWFALVKDLLQAAIWLVAFLGNRVEWRGQLMRVRRDGTLVRT
jgi:ceramide glucosyltransferase